MRRSSLLLAVALLLPGCGSFGGDPGTARTEDRPIDDASAVELATSGDLTLSAGETAALTITAGENVLEHLTSEVSDGRLTLDTDESVGNLGDVRYELVLPDVRAIELSGSGTVQVAAPSALDHLVLSGSGEVTVDGLSPDELAVQLPGSGDITITGDAPRQTVSIDGSGSYQATDLSSKEAEVTIDGSGTADVTVSDSLQAVVEGSGTVTYGGDPDVDSQVDGSGEVRPR